jgi:ankyrin repeat protein
MSVTIALVHEGANINLPIENGWRALHIAAKLGDIKIIRLLVECGANVKLLNKPLSILDDQLYAATDNIFTANSFQTALEIAQ